MRSLPRLVLSLAVWLLPCSLVPAVAPPPPDLALSLSQTVRRLEAEVAEDGHCLLAEIGCRRSRTGRRRG